MDRVLIVDDEPQIRVALSEVLRLKGYEVECAASGEEGLARIKDGLYNLVITDVKMPGIGGVGLLRAVCNIAPGLPVLMMTAFGTIENAIEAMRDGARDYILKPFSPDVLEASMRRILATRHDESEFGIIGESEQMVDILNVARRVANTTATILIMGESGTGKEVIARFIHGLSNRADETFVAINCASIPDGLLESELFGHERGAFTGAITRRVGKFEAANRGSILLDEVGEMGMLLQAKLLRVLQEREIDVVGSKSPLSIDVRIIATTNRNLQEEVEKGKFREDLFYRLNVFPIVIPPLRERPEDILPLARHFLEVLSKKNNREIGGIEKKAAKILQGYQWKGNVREMENVIERAVLMCQGDELTCDDLFYGESRTVERDGVSAATSIREMERSLIFKTLKEMKENKTLTARALGISIRTLRNKLKEYRGVEHVA
ncbi:MAG: sigma-54-dependent transcriptional regulator [Thermodesulfobacteriota bacterium]